MTCELGQIFRPLTGTGEKLHNHQVLSTVQDWHLPKEAAYIPREHCSDITGPDIALVSETTMQVVLLELTGPWEEQVDKARERRKSKHDKLENEYQRRRWRTDADNTPIS